MTDFQAPQPAHAAHLVMQPAGADVYVHGVKVPDFPIGTAADPRRQAFVDAVNQAARAAIPAPEGEPSDAAVELAAKAVYRLFIGADDHPWVEGGNSLKQCDARRYARAALAAQPLPPSPRQPQAAPVAQWLPIETAPRGSGEDGPHDTRDPAYIEPPTLLLWTQEGPRVGYYDWYYHPGYGRGADPHESPWRCAEGSQAYGPTHWMPLPAAPQTKEPTNDR